jgi:CubicO group peptidase (beta-lactamase class C family)
VIPTLPWKASDLPSTRHVLTALILTAGVLSAAACNRQPAEQATEAELRPAPDEAPRPPSRTEAPAPRRLSPQAASTEERIALVENGLMRSVRFAGRNNRRKLADRMSQLNVPGVSIAVIYDGAIEWTRGYGVRERGTDGEVDTDTIFQAGSISKPIAVIAALRLAETGKLDLDADINTYLETWSVPANRHTQKQAPTIRHILSHSAGFTVHGFPGYAAGTPVPSLVQVLDGVTPANTEPIRIGTPPGGEFRYSGGGTTVLQQAMIDVVDAPFPTIMASQVLEPAGMGRSTYEQPLPERFHDNAAVGHDALGKPVPGKWHTYPELAAAGLWTTPSDLARVLIDLQQTLAGKGGKLLGRNTVEQALKQQAKGNVGSVGAPLGHMGLGFVVAHAGGDLRFGHGGTNQGFTGQMTAHARLGSGVVVLTNGLGGSHLASEIINAIANVYGWPEHHFEEVDIAPLDEVAFDRIAGTYAFDPNLPLPIKTVTFSREGQMLNARIDDGLTSEMYPVGPRRYLVLEPSPAELVFIEESGKPPRVEAQLGPRKLVATRVRE